MQWNSEFDFQDGPKRLTEQIQKYDLSCQQVPAAVLWQTRMDIRPCMKNDGKLTIHATPWAKQFRDDINSLKESDKGDDFVCELNGD